MQNFLKIPLWFFFIAACLGLLLRWHFISPIPDLVYPYWLHAHSHMMFLGWVLNVLYLAYVLEFIPAEKQTRYRVLFIIIQGLITGMLISFPLQGYGAVSIALSTLHTISIGVFCWWFFRDTKQRLMTPALRYARFSLIFFLISAAGPFSLAPLMANGLGQSPWYYFAVYFYLHFQYNGVFVFGVLSLFHTLLEGRGVPMDYARAYRSARLLFSGTILSYALSILWSEPHFLFNGIGFIGALLQSVALWLFLKSISWSRPCFFQCSSSARCLFVLSGSALMLKTFLQLISAHPDAALLAYEVRPFVIAYLHLVVIGVVTFFIIGWYCEKVFGQLKRLQVILLITGFIGSELVMIFGSTPIHLPAQWSVVLVFIFSVLMTFTAGWFLFTARQRI